MGSKEMAMIAQFDPCESEIVYKSPVLSDNERNSRREVICLGYCLPDILAARIHSVGYTSRNP